MPSKTRTNRATKASKENICVVKINKLKGSGKVLKNSRKPLSDKTNSASDDNASIISSDKQHKIVDVIPTKQLKEVCEENVQRPRRARRPPARYKDINTLNNLSNNNNESLKLESPQAVRESYVSNVSLHDAQTPALKVLVKKKTSPTPKVKQIQVTPSKSPLSDLDCSLLANRPKRVCRLPSKFHDHSISPNKYIPVHPINASTPLATKVKKVNNKNIKENTHTKTLSQRVSAVTVSKKKIPRQAAVSNSVKDPKSSDTNNNAKQNKKKQVLTVKSPVKIFKTRSTLEQNSDKKYSPKLLENKKKQLKRDSSKLDVYEFTFDPDEEPPPVKKKKRKPVAKQPKPKTVIIKSSYDKNLAKALAALKNTVTSKLCNNETVKRNEELIIREGSAENKFTNNEQNANVIEQRAVNERNYNSVRVEDIAHDIHVSEDDHAIDYSPVNSPSHPKSPTDHVEDCLQGQKNEDPLNLQDNLSFFDEIPVASSSMNVSVRHPAASPWRVEFGSLPIKWHVNAYVKPNMTPAVESSFINFNDSKKKHVYTNIVPEADDTLAQIVDNSSNLKQTSIISFIKEVVERNMNKKNKGKSTPVKANSIFEDLTDTSVVHKSPNKHTPEKINPFITLNTDKPCESNKSNESHEKEYSDIVNIENIEEVSKTPRDLNKNADKNNTYFGFDDIEDQENVSPTKKNKRAKSLKSRSRGILQEINEHKGPTRAIIPVAAKTKPAQNNINNLHEEMKSATEPPVFPEVAVDYNTDKEAKELERLSENFENDDSQSVHLFEDIEFIHHQRAGCKSYVKSKKVTFNKSVVPLDDCSSSEVDVRGDCTDEDDLDDLSFKLPSERPKKTHKKKKPKKQLSKKEEKEVEAWAAGFNSMCEDIEEFDLVVE